MLIRPAIFGPILVIALTATSTFGQNATYSPPPTSVGVLQYPGVVGRSDPMLYFGRVGGTVTGRLDPLPPAISQRGFGPAGPNTGPGPGMGLPSRGSRLSGVLNPREGLPGYTGGGGRIQSPMEYRPRTVSPRNTFDYNRNQTFATRHELARAAIPSAAVRETGILADWRIALGRRAREMTPIERFHSDANLLRPKSALGQLITTQDMALYQAVSPAIKPTGQHEMATIMEGLDHEAELSRSFDEATAQRLNKQYHEYERSGVDFFKSKNWIRARDCFDICRSLDRKNPWPPAIDTLVALETDDVSRAVNSLIEAVKRESKLDDIWLNHEQLYGSKLEFEKCVDKANFLASQDQSDKFQAGHFLLAYCAWLNGDLATAAASAQSAAKSMPLELRADMQRFADQLKEKAAEPTRPTT